MEEKAKLEAEAEEKVKKEAEEKAQKKAEEMAIARPALSATIKLKEEQMVLEKNAQVEVVKIYS